MARIAPPLGALLLLLCAVPEGADERNGVAKLDLVLRQAAAGPERLRVIIQTTDVAAVEARVVAAGGRAGRRLTGINAIVAEVPGSSLPLLASAAEVRAVSVDRRIAGALDRTGETIGSRWVLEHLGFDGTGIGVAIVDSGVAAAHDDLVGRVAQFVDFVDGQTQPRDGYGHGTHVAGIIAGSGYDSDGARRGIAPGAHLVVLRALDARGEGFISSAIAAIDYAVDQRAAYNIRVLNLSVAGGVYESYRTDPLALAARRAVDAGIAVVTAAGNLGRADSGRPQYGGITSPGNAPWVITVGAAGHNGTIDRRDDSVAPFSSIGPTAIDGVQKPDLVAPGVGIESLAEAGSTLFEGRPQARLWGSVPTADEPYLSLSGTSMAAPVVSGAIALMLQANPALTPAAVKMILRASAERHADVPAAVQGAGFLDACAAVTLAGAFAAAPSPTPFAAGGDTPAVAATPCAQRAADCTAAGPSCRVHNECSWSRPGLFAALTETPLAMPRRVGRATTRRSRATGRRRA